MELLALSDHDTVDGVDEALAAGAVHGVRVVPATEISAVDGEYEDLHVLGYGIDHRSALLGERLLDARADRERRADAMAERLRELGFEVDPAPIEARKAAGKPVGRPHLAAAVLAHPANAERLCRGGPRGCLVVHPGVPDPGQARLRGALSPHRGGGDLVDSRRRRGGRLGAPVLGRQGQRRGAARPSTATAPPGSMASRSSTPLTRASRRCCSPQRCEELGLLMTGSSDYHGPDHRLFSRFRAFDLHGCEPNLGPIAHGTLAAPTRTGSALCFWLTGLSGSGKSTVGRLAAGQLRDRGHHVEVLDGDDVRQNLCAGLGFSREDRDVNVRRIAWVADLLSRNGVVTFVAAVSPYRGTRDEARARMGERFVEVHVRASVDECERRDVKGLYERARAGEIQAFTGVSDPYEEPLAAELTLETESESPEESAAKLVEYVERRLSGSAEREAAPSA